MFRYYTTLFSFSVLTACQAHMAYESESPEELSQIESEDQTNTTQKDVKQEAKHTESPKTEFVQIDAMDAEQGEAEVSITDEVDFDQTATLSPEPAMDAPSPRKGRIQEEMAVASEAQQMNAILMSRLESKEDRAVPSRSKAKKALPPAASGMGMVGSGYGGGGISSNYQQPIEESPIPRDIISSEEYTDYGVNPFTKTESDALSTFSIDVDTASYTIARRKINSGTLPPFASVRVEEFINFFDYNYDASEASPFTVHMEGMEDPFHEDHHILRVGIQGKEFTPQTRPPLRLTFLVDVSGSMSSEDKLPMAQKALHLLVDELDERDSVAIATYAGHISAVLQPTSGADRKSIHQAIDRLSSGGSTAMSSGLDLAYQMAWNSFEQGAENRVVVLSDGDANVGRTSWEEMLRQIKSYADRGVTMSTIGLGMRNYKDTRMEQLANKGDGNNYYIDSFEQAKRVFVEDFQSTMISIARDVKIQVEFDPKQVESYRLIGYENRDIADKDFRNDRVDAGEVGAGHNVTALYELILTENARSKDDLATVRLRYESPGADKAATERSWNIDVAEVENNPRPSEELRLAYTAATFGEILRRSPHATKISFEDLISYGSKAQRRGEKDDAELLELMKKASALQIQSGVVQR